MQGYNFTERVRKSLAYAREEAALLHHEYVGTEHLLFGIIREGEGVAMAVLANLKVDTQRLRQGVVDILKKGAATHQGPDLPYSSRAKKVLELAMTAARELEHGYVGTEHLLLGLLAEEKGIAAQALNGAGVTSTKARASVVDLLGKDPKRPSLGQPAAGDFMYAVVNAPAFVEARLALTVSAVFAVVIGLTLIFNARGFEAPMGIVVDDWTETIAQAQGAVLLGLGIINWLARSVTDRSALWAVLYGNFVVQAVSFAIVLRALARGIIPAAGIGALVMHLILGAAFAWVLWRPKKR